MRTPVPEAFIEKPLGSARLAWDALGAAWPKAAYSVSAKNDAVVIEGTIVGQKVEERRERENKEKGRGGACTSRQASCLSYIIGKKV